MRILLISLLFSSIIFAGGIFDDSSGITDISPSLVGGYIVNDMWSDNATYPETNLYCGNMTSSDSSWFGGTRNLMRAWAVLTGTKGFADYRIENSNGPIYAARVYNTFSANQLDLTLDHYYAYKSSLDSDYTDYYVFENWNLGSPAGSGYGAVFGATAQAFFTNPGKSVNLRFGVRDLTTWAEWYGSKFCVWGASEQSQFADNYKTSPLNSSVAGSMWDSSGLVWANEKIDSSSWGTQPMECKYIVAYKDPIDTIDIRLSSTDKAASYEAVFTSAATTLNIAIGYYENGPWTTIWSGSGTYTNVNNPGAVFELENNSRILFVRIFTTSSTNSHYARWGGFHVKVTSNQTGLPYTCEEVIDRGLGLSGDINSDCVVDMGDLAVILSSWLEDNTYATTPAVETSTDRKFGDILGMNCHFNQLSNIRNLQYAKDIGVRSIRDELSWNTTERQKGVYKLPIYSQYWIDAICDSGIDLLLHLGYGNSLYDNPYDADAYSNYAAFAALKLKDKVTKFNCLNEPHNFGFSAYYGGSWNGADPSPWVAKYAELVRKTAGMVYQVAPKTLIMPDEDVLVNHYRFLDEDMGPYIRALSWHPYNHSEIGPEYIGWVASPQHSYPYQVADADGSYISTIQMLKAKAFDKYSRNLDIYATEIGWRIGENNITEQDMANYLVRSYIISYANNVRVLYWYNLQDSGGAAFGLLDEDYNKRPAYYAYKNLSQTLGDLHLISQLNGQDDYVAGVHAYLFGDESGQGNVLVYWTADDTTQQITISSLTADNRLLDSEGNVESVDNPVIFTTNATAEPKFLIGIGNDASIY